MIIKPEAYYNLIQMNWQARCEKYQRTESQDIEDLKWTPEQWTTKICAQLGVIAMGINNQDEDHSLLADIVQLADLTRSYFWVTAKLDLDFIKEIEAERERQIEQWGHQVHSRQKWCLIVAEEVGELAEAIDIKKPKADIILELIQISAVLQAWVTSRDWFYPPKTPHVTGCKNCGEVFETEEGQLIKCPSCETQHDFLGNKVERRKTQTEAVKLTIGENGEIQREKVL